jgi:tetratricopeptide (TPR) repeat protein
MIYKNVLVALFQRHVAATEPRDTLTNILAVHSALTDGEDEDCQIGLRRSKFVSDDLEDLRLKVIFTARRNLKEAKLEASRLIENFPESGLSWGVRSYVNQKMGLIGEALKDAGMAISVQPNEPGNHFRIAGIFVDEQRFVDAISHLTLSISIGEKHQFNYYEATSRMFLAFCYCKLGDFESAKSELGQVTDNSPIWIDRLWSKQELIDVCKRRGSMDIDL